MVTTRPQAPPWAKEGLWLLSLKWRGYSQELSQAVKVRGCLQGSGTSGGSIRLRPPLVHPKTVTIGQQMWCVKVSRELWKWDYFHFSLQCGHAIKQSDMVFLCRCSDGVLPLAHYVAFLDLPAGWFEIINSQSGSFKIFGFRGQCSEQKILKKKFDGGQCNGQN